MEIPQQMKKFNFEFKKYFHPVYRKMVRRRDEMGDVLTTESCVCHTYEEAINILRNGYKFFREDRVILTSVEDIELYGKVKCATPRPLLPIGEEEGELDGYEDDI